MDGLNLALLPEKAVSAIKDGETIKILKVASHDESVHAAETYAYVKMLEDQFLEACEPHRKELYDPYKQWTEMISKGKDFFDNFLKAQKKEISIYDMEVLRIENENRRIMQEKINAENKARIDAENEKRRKEAEESGKQAEIIEFKPHEAVEMNVSGSQGAFAREKTKMIPEGVITDLEKFIDSLISSGKGFLLKSFILKISDSKINNWLKDEGMDGVTKSFPGISITMVPDTKIRAR
jgi:hypothetical protein